MEPMQVKIEEKRAARPSLQCGNEIDSTWWPTLEPMQYQQSIYQHKASGKLRVSPHIERARVICQSPRKNLGKELAFGARARHG